MLSKPVYLLICVIEECAEIIQRCCKAIRFGFDEVQPGQILNNVDRICGEVDDFVGVAKMLEEECDIRILHEDGVAIRAKISKVRSYMPLSRERGMLEDDV